MVKFQWKICLNCYLPQNRTIRSRKCSAKDCRGNLRIASPEQSEVFSTAASEQAAKNRRMLEQMLSRVAPAEAQ